MKKLGSIIVAGLIALGALGLTAVSTTGCSGAHKPYNGTCHPGRTWVPEKKSGDKWKAGYCQNQ